MTSRTRARYFTPLLVLLTLAPACGDSTPEQRDAGFGDIPLAPPDVWDPGDRPNGCSYGYGESCPEAVSCADDPCVHGVCVRTAGESDYCLCDPGYAGLRCEGCAEGYQQQGLSCIPVSPCPGSPCVYGTCRPQSGGGFTCDCYTGYTGRYCDQCADGYHPENLECVPD